MSASAPELAARGIRSYVLRRSHFSASQRDAYRRLMPIYGVPFDEKPLNFEALFGRRAATILEIGFGMGDTTAEIAATHPECDFLGVEVHTPGIGALLKMIESRALRNVRIIEYDALAVLDKQIPDQALTGVHIFFPDPWPKVRHHKRRLLQKHFVTLLARKLRPGGYLHVATDWSDYAAQITEVVDSTPELAMPQAETTQQAGALPVIAGAAARPMTKFEQRGLRLGHRITDILRVRRTT